MSFPIILLLGSSNLARWSFKFIGWVLNIATVFRNAHIREHCPVIDYQKSKVIEEAYQKKGKKTGQIHDDVYSDAFSSPEIGRMEKRRLLRGKAKKEAA
jgi:hypothetical protein